MVQAPHFDQAFRAQLYELFRWRRDVRRFRGEPISVRLLEELLQTAALAPSVGLSEPWRFVVVEDASRRVQVRDSFLKANAAALAGYEGERAHLYSTLKLEGIDHAPVHLGVFCDGLTLQGHGLGCGTMPETLAYSVVAAIQTLWLAARAHGLGLGWVSILNPVEVKQALAVPSHWQLVAYLCLGYPAEESHEPTLAEVGWAQRQNMDAFIIQR